MEGKSDQEIENLLSTSGWKMEDIRHTFESLNNGVPLPPKDYENIPTKQSSLIDENDQNPSSEETDTGKKPVRYTLWDAFENVMMFVTMGITAIASGVLLNMFIDQTLFFEESAMRYYSTGWMEIYVAALIVVVPIFSFFFIRVTKRTKLYPELKRKTLRLVLVYIAMIITSIIVIIDLIVVLTRFLSGEINLEAVFDTLIIVGISALIFMYALNQTKEDRKIE